MNIEYEEMVVTFIDILGFKKLIESENIEEVRKIIDRFNGFKNLSMLCHKTGDPNNDAFNSISASDAIIRLTRFPENYNKEQIIIKEIEVLASIQLKLICDHKILIRGGLSIGKMYFNYNNRLTSFFGPAYIRAYEIESKTASYPRIVIDKKLKTEKFDKINNSLISSDIEGDLFIDYLEKYNSNEEPNDFLEQYCIEEHNEHYLKKHKNSIVQLINESENITKSIKDKYLWLALYHNKHCMKNNYSVDCMIDSITESDH